MKKYIRFFALYIYSLKQVIGELRFNKLKPLIPLFVLLYIIGIFAFFTFFVTPLAPFVYSLF